MAVYIETLDEEAVRARLNEMKDEEGGRYIHVYVLGWLHEEMQRMEIAARTTEEEHVYKNALDGIGDAMAELIGRDVAQSERRG